MTGGLRALLIAMWLCGCAHEAVQIAGDPETTFVPFSATGCEHFIVDRAFRAPFRSAEPEKVFQVLADVTCFTFVVERGIKARLTLDADRRFTGSELFTVVTAELEKQGVTVTEEAPRRYRVSAVR